MSIIKRLFKNNERKNNEKKLEEILDQIRDLYRWGCYDPVKIAEEIGQPESSVRKWLSIVEEEEMKNIGVCIRNDSIKKSF